MVMHKICDGSIIPYRIHSEQGSFYLSITAYIVTGYTPAYTYSQMCEDDRSPIRVEAARVLVGSFGVLAALGSVWYVAQNPKLSSSAKTGSVLMLLLGALVPVRFAALGNHSYLHAFFTHRALCSTVFALLAALRLTTLKNRKKGAAR